MSHLINDHVRFRLDKAMELLCEGKPKEAQEALDDKNFHTALLRCATELREEYNTMWVLIQQAKRGTA